MEQCKTNQHLRVFYRLICISIYVAIIVTIGAVIGNAQPRGSWSYFANTPFESQFFEIQKLDQSRALFIGNQGECFVIDAYNQTFREVGRMRTYRSAFASVRTADGKVYVFGGTYSPEGTLVEVYDPQTETWSDAGNLLLGRSQLNALLISPYEVLIVGGRTDFASGVIAQCEIFNIYSGKSVQVSDFPYKTSFGQLILTKDNRILAFSGRSDGPSSYRSQVIHEYLRGEKVWVEAGLLFKLCYYPTITNLKNGEFYLTGGSTAESNDFGDYQTSIATLRGSNFIETNNRLAEPRCGHVAVQLGSEWLFVVGGIANDNSSLRTCEFINISSGKVFSAPPTNSKHSYFKGTVLRNKAGKLVVFAVAGSTTAIEMFESDIEEPFCEVLTTTSLVTNSADVSLRGSAQKTDTTIVLTGTEQYEAGAVWHNALVNVSNGFETTFSFRLSNGNDNSQPDFGSPGADGVAFVIQNKAVAPIGLSGEGIGYNEMPSGLAVEFDSYLNAAYSDPTGSHVAIQKGNGIVLSTSHTAEFNRGLAFENVPSLVADGSVYYAKISVGAFAEFTEINVYLDKTAEFKMPVLTSYIGNLLETVNADDFGRTRIGITSATGKSVQRHELLTWTVTGCESLISDVNETQEFAANNPAISIQPMPVGDVCSVVLEQSNEVGELVVVDVLGHHVARASIAPGKHIISLPTNGWSSGTYVAQVIYPNTTISTVFQVLSK